MSPLPRRNWHELMTAHARVAGACLLLSASATAAEESVPPALFLNVTGFSGVWTQYVSRGCRLSEGAVEQNSVSLLHGSFGATIWNNIDFRAHRLTETDLSLSWAGKIRAASCTVAFTHYAIPHGLDSEEASCALQWDNLPLRPNLSVYVDVNRGTGVYAQFSLTHAVKLHPRASLLLTADASALVENRYTGVNAAGHEYTDLLAGETLATLLFSLGHSCALELRCGYTFGLSKNGRETISGTGFGAKTTTTYSGIQFDFAF